MDATEQSPPALEQITRSVESFWRRKRCLCGGVLARGCRSATAPMASVAMMLLCYQY
ncbi:hypothetical protein PF002_g11483 [Phytophthora fragariae]|uniref:Uncharacterized protein n=1 Tax=Phytophthora fragariae TaxID=53985 RepID=A0A6A3ZHQ4_9STRA|nr:hypothetical protein PF002_g11483 [Phytophthora fragariae]